MSPLCVDLRSATSGAFEVIQSLRVTAFRVTANKATDKLPSNAECGCLRLYTADSTGCQIYVLRKAGNFNARLGR